MLYVFAAEVLGDMTAYVTVLLAPAPIVNRDEDGATCQPEGTVGVMLKFVGIQPAVSRLVSVTE
jgi:hypothetical protein